MIKLKKISQKNLTNDEVRAYDAKGNSKTGMLRGQDGTVYCISKVDMSPLKDIKYYIKLSDIDSEARKQIKELEKV